MANRPSEMTVRAYDVGFGDCFLLSFKYPTQSRHILIDFGSTRLPEGKAVPGDGTYMERVAKQIEKDCEGKLTAVVATHRHKDHISGFTRTGEKGPGAIIRSLEPELVLQPWTEDPKIARDAKGPAAKLKGLRFRRNAFVQSLSHMNRYASHVADTSSRLKGRHLRSAREQLSFLGDDNGLANRSAILNLMTMGRRPARYLFSGAATGLEQLLPNIKVHVLGPPTLKQDPRVATQTSKQADEFWHLRSAFWASRGDINARGSGGIPPLFPRHLYRGRPWNSRWYCYKAQREQAESLLSIVRTLDDAMNNTSLILLFEIGDTCLLFPGDAQWENWRFALSQPKYISLLKRVNLYKVGHHGSLNATPKSLWKTLPHKGGPRTVHRLITLLSTKDGVHGDTPQTAVPRSTLVKELREQSSLVDTREARPSELSKKYSISLNT